MVLQNDIGNRYSPTVIVAAITSQVDKTKLPIHVEMGASDGLEKESVILLEQIRTLDKKRLREKVAHLDDPVMARVDDALAVSVGLKEI